MTIEKKRLLRDSQLTMLKVARNDYLAQEVVPPHLSGDCYHLVLVDRGAGELTVNDRRYPIAGDRFYFISPQARIAFHFSEMSTIKNFKFKLYDEALEQTLFSYPMHGRCGSDDWADLKQWFQLSVEYKRRKR